MIYIGIDNGASGSMAAIDERGSLLYCDKIPSKVEPNFQKQARNITRLDHIKFKQLLKMLVKWNHGLLPQKDCRVVMENPFSNKFMFTACMASNRCFEAQLVVIEQLGLQRRTIPAPQWQKVMLPHKTKDTKLASKVIAMQLFPRATALVKTHKDGDALLIAEYARRMRY